MFVVFVVEIKEGIVDGYIKEEKATEKVDMLRHKATHEKNRRCT